MNGIRMLDFEALTIPVSAEDPSGPDLDTEGNAEYLNFFAGTEPLLPMSYFEVVKPSGERGRFDPKAVDFEAQVSAAKPLLMRTRDLRVIVLLAKLSILNRDLSGFTKCLIAIAKLLETQWATVHPRDDNGDFTYRAVTIESLDVLPTVVNPIQLQPLIDNRRYGVISYRAYQVAKGEIASTDETDLDLATIERIVSETELDVLKAISAQFTELAVAIARIKTIWLEKAGPSRPLSLERVATMVDGIAGWLLQLVRQRDPSSIEVSQESPGAASEEGTSSELAQVGSVKSQAQAAAALQAVAEYFARSEPSNPALLLVRQAHEMVGKSFVEVMRMLVPAHVEAAAINIGRDKFFDLPIERMAVLPAPEAPSPASSATAQDPVFNAESRATALMLLNHVAIFFRGSEPSSPIPFLIDRARELAQRDFLSLLQDVLPEGTLKTFNS
jgi:type VI secretion system protein ImpA